ncbi:hypothetical protein [Bifidobacterium asteroides]|nr:hypothetical protein [Bifidobacterium asteroides]
MKNQLSLEVLDGIVEMARFSMVYKQRSLHAITRALMKLLGEISSAK